MMKSRKIGRRCGTLTFALLASAACAGCGAEPGGGEGGATVTRKAAVSSTAYTDWSGLVTVHVKICDWSPVGSSPGAWCEVDPGQVLIGGGAEVEGMADGGGLLWGSAPIDGEQAWWAGSKDHVTYYPHRIRAYAVGLELAYMDYDTLASLVTRTTGSSPCCDNQPWAAATAPAGHIMLGGGGRINWAEAGLLLTESDPGGEDTWLVKGTDHEVPDPSGSAVAIVISIPRCLNGLWWGGCLRSLGAGWATAASTGYSMSSMLIPDGWVPAGVGARAEANSYGRFITDAYPMLSDGSPGATLFTKDHDYADDGGNVVTAMAISADPVSDP
jgi:vibriolysin